MSRAVEPAHKFQAPISGKIFDLRNFWLRAMCACTEQYSTHQIRWEL